MVWRRGDTQDSYDSSHAIADRAMPWQRGKEPGRQLNASEVVVEKWDDELPRRVKSSRASASARRTRDRLRPASMRVLNMLIFAAAVIGALAGIGVAWMHVLNDPGADAHAYYEAAARLNAGHALYPAGIDPSSNHIYLYPPLFAIALRPLALLPFEAFALAWELVVVASFVALLRYLGVRRRAVWLGIGLLGVPIGWCLTIAQAHLPMTLLLALGQPWSIALAANLKLTPVLMVLWWLGRREWQAVLAFAVWLALLAGVQLALDWKDTLAFFSSVGVDQIGQVRNISPFAQSPVLWIGLVLLGAAVTLALARTRWGWPAAVTLVTLSPPRLIVYMLAGLAAALREPRVAGDFTRIAAPQIGTPDRRSSR